MSSVTLEADRASRSADEGLFADVFGFTSTVGLGLGSGIKYNLLFLAFWKISVLKEKQKQDCEKKTSIKKISAKNSFRGRSFFENYKQ